jgi:hypothetical protein
MLAAADTASYDYAIGRLEIDLLNENLVFGDDKAHSYN